MAGRLQMNDQDKVTNIGCMLAKYLALNIGPRHLSIYYIKVKTANFIKMETSAAPGALWLCAISRTKQAKSDLLPITFYTA